MLFGDNEGNLQVPWEKNSQNLRSVGMEQSTDDDDDDGSWWW